MQFLSAGWITAALLSCEFIHSNKEVDMTPEATQEYQRAIEEAANAFMKVMRLRGFSVRDYPHNFVAQMATNTRLAFETDRQGPHLRADVLVADMLKSAAHSAAPLVAVNPEKKRPFVSLSPRMA
ncbi:MAG: hypothetical protein ACK52H_02420 [Burkholderiales bacterium]|jgi:hypothetical protein|uniref:hypothetical protein n=1 Tax=Limnohabitans sp. TaxID=1907725 RepID=UPI0025EF5978|nr:hypothetical protein [Limnohabitans sp.]